MNKLKKAISAIVFAAFSEYVEKGGKIKRAGLTVDVGRMTSPAGAVPALVWVAQKFYEDYQVALPVVTFKADPGAEAGFVIDAVQSNGGGSATFLLTLADFLRNEVFPANVVEVDLDLMLVDFNAWCQEVMPPSAIGDTSPLPTQGIHDDPQ